MKLRCMIGVEKRKTKYLVVMALEIFNILCRRRLR